ncbi:MAG: hypothetical protein V4594_25425 [Bacteroidota bacterium]
MKATVLNLSRKGDVELVKGVMVFIILVLLCPVVQHLVMNVDPTIGPVDLNILVLVLLGLVCFMGLMYLCWWAFQRFLMVYELPEIGSMVLKFNELEVWEQLRLYVALYALLFLGAAGCLIAIC